MRNLQSMVSHGLVVEIDATDGHDKRAKGLEGPTRADILLVFRDRI